MGREYRWYGTAKSDGTTLVERSDLVSIVARPGKDLLQALGEAERKKVLAKWERILVRPGDGRTLLQLKKDADGAAEEQQDRLIKALRAAAPQAVVEPGLASEQTRAPVLPSGTIYVRVRGGLDAGRIDSLVKKAQAFDFVVGAEPVPAGSPGAYSLQTRGASNENLFAATEAMRGEDDVEISYPRLGRKIRALDANELEWHLRRTQVNDPAAWTIVDAGSEVVAAWSITRGYWRRWWFRWWYGWWYRFLPFIPWWRPPRVRVAILDMGVDVDHAEFAGWFKVIGGANVICGPPDDPRPVHIEDHGTRMAGLAVARGLHGASGAAPDAALVPIRMMGFCPVTLDWYATDDADLVAAFQKALEADADVISCSWMVDVGDEADEVLLKIAEAASAGRDGKGCVVLFATAEKSYGYTSADDNPYAAHADVIGVGASGANSTLHDQTLPGKSLWCLFPSGDAVLRPLRVLDPSGISGIEAGDYALNTDGGTSQACAGAAGVAALVVAANRALTAGQVKKILGESCDRIDAGAAGYDSDGRSDSHGHGRLNALRAVMNARAWVES